MTLPRAHASAAVWVGVSALARMLLSCLVTLVFSLGLGFG